ncbi:glycosyltransferase family 2 protein [Candidatus Dojkabacteria bacterium]|nr:glycosyltransferase family 2 protein [Candidatus Dojkabacteria bacterium]
MITSSVCIVTRNRVRSLRRCLSALSKLTKHPDEIIIIENNPDRHLEYLINSFPNLNIIYQIEATRNIAVARNRAIMISSKECVIFIDDDCFPKCNWLSEILSDFNDKTVIAVVGSMHNHNWHSSIAKAEQNLYNNWFDKFYSLQRRALLKSGEFLNTRNLAIRRSFLVRTSCLFDINAPHKIEDTDFGIRIFQIKFDFEKILFNPRAIVMHENSISLVSFFLRRYYSGKGKYFLNQTHKEWELRASKNKSYAKKEIFSIRILLWLERQFFRIGYFSAKFQYLVAHKANVSDMMLVPKLPILWSSESVEIQTLLCKNDVNIFIFSMSQLFNVLGYRIPIRVYPDESIGKDEICQIRSKLQKVTFTKSENAFLTFNPWLREKNFFSKRFSSFSYSKADKLIFMDPDVLFLNKPIFIDTWIKSRSVSNYYLRDAGNYYSYSDFEIHNISKSHLAKKVSAGLLLINKNIYSGAIQQSIAMGIKTVQLLEKQRVIGGFKDQPYWYLDQTIWANFLYRTKAKMLPDSYLVYADIEWNKSPLPGLISAIHFSGPFKNQLKHYQSELLRSNSIY